MMPLLRVPIKALGPFYRSPGGSAHFKEDVLLHVGGLEGHKDNCKSHVWREERETVGGLEKMIKADDL